MTRIEALKALLAKVEAGEFPTLWRDVNAAGLAHNSFGLACGGWCRDAFSGSLDAAKALDAAIPTPDAVMTPEEMDAVLFHPLGARFWLSWKIRALIAQEEAA